ncbi:MAG: replicative DNA helicase [Chlamydiota bacterium]
MELRKEKIKVAPNSKESEMMVLGCMLTSVNSMNVAADGLKTEDFYYKEHQIIFEILQVFYKSDKPADIHILGEELKKKSHLESIGGIGYLTTLAQYAGTSAYIEEYVKLVQEKAILRKMIQAAQAIEKTALEEPEDVHNILDEAQSHFFQISQSVNAGSGVLIRDLLSGLKAESGLPYLKELQERQETFRLKGPDELKITGVPTHFVDLDKLINGFHSSNLMILAARPAMGKTALALNIAENICFKNHLPVGIFSLEMSASQLVHRIICSQSEVESEKIQTGSLNGSEYQRIVASVNMMQKNVLVIDDQPGLKITDMRARARRMKEVYNIQFLVIDYLQLVAGSGASKSFESRQMEVSEISRMLKNMARELNIPVLCLSQLSRKVEERQGHRPMMSDLRESGCLTGDTRIYDVRKKVFVTMKELSSRKKQEPVQVYAIENGKIQEHTMTKVFYSGKKRVYEIETQSKKTIRASENHPFLQRSGWTRVDAMQVGEEVATFTESLSWEKIVDIRKMEIEDVYDATVDVVHNFVASGFVVHNSIEQDSDLVMFLLRREYYDPYDKPSLAELIIAKNRHGKIGVVNMTFRKELAQFANYISLDGGVQNQEAFAEFSPQD